MTRAPLPGKLPEWPEKPVFINDSTLRYVTDDGRIEDFKTSEGNNAIVLWGYEQRRAAYWESRARLAVEALHGLMVEVEQAISQGSVPVSWTDWAPPDKALVNARDALQAIGPLPPADGGGRR